MPRFGIYNVDDDTHGIEEVAQSDAQAAITAVRNANSSKMKHVRRTIGVSLAWLHKKWVNRRGARLEHKKGTDLSADAMTKRLSRVALERTKDAFGITPS